MLWSRKKGTHLKNLSSLRFAPYWRLVVLLLPCQCYALRMNSSPSLFYGLQDFPVLACVLPHVPLPAHSSHGANVDKTALPLSSLSSNTRCSCHHSASLTLHQVPYRSGPLHFLLPPPYVLAPPYFMVQPRLLSLLDSATFFAWDARHLFVQKWAQADFLLCLLFALTRAKGGPVTRRSDMEGKQRHRAWQLTKLDHTALGDTVIPKAAGCGSRRHDEVVLPMSLHDMNFIKLLTNVTTEKVCQWFIFQITIIDCWLPDRHLCSTMEQAGLIRKKSMQKMVKLETYFYVDTEFLNLF